MRRGAVRSDDGGVGVLLPLHLKGGPLGSEAALDGRGVAQAGEFRGVWNGGPSLHIRNLVMETGKMLWAILFRHGSPRGCLDISVYSVPSDQRAL